MTYEKKRDVKKEEIDNLGHVNNIVYLKWFMDIASEHSEKAGWPQSRMIEMGEGWVVKRHEIEYIASVMPGETVIIRTWISEWKRASCVREYEVIRERDGKTMCCGKSVWVWINYKNGKISHIPGEIREKL